MSPNLLLTSFTVIPMEGDNSNSNYAHVNGFTPSGTVSDEPGAKQSRRRNVQDAINSASEKPRRNVFHLKHFSFKRTTKGTGDPEKAMSARSYVTVSLLFFVNLLNYMDRFTIAGVLTEIQEYYSIGDWEAGLLQTVFITFYMIFAPVFGYLGDRYSRKMIMIAGVVIWSGAVLLSTFVPSEHFFIFLFLRGVVGIGEASYATVSITLLGDLFTNEMRSRMLMVFYFAVPVGSGLGFIVGSLVTSLAGGHWQWGVRVTPPLGILCIITFMLTLREPKRGAAEQGSIIEVTSWKQDLKYLIQVRSYVWSTLGFTCVAFVVGSLSWWTPNYMIYSQRSTDVDHNNAHINTVFGVIMGLSGFAGVAIGSNWAHLWRRKNPRAEPLVCAIGMLISVPFLFASLIVVGYSLVVAWCLMFVTVTSLCLNWSIMSDILLSVITPYRRSTASAFQILVSHLLGDAVSPYIIGQLSDLLRGSDTSDTVHFQSLQYSLFATPFASLIGAFFFFGSAWYIERDRYNMQMTFSGSTCNLKKSEASDDGTSASVMSSDLVFNSSQDMLVPNNEGAVNEISPSDEHAIIADIGDKKSS